MSLMDVPSYGGILAAQRREALCFRENGGVDFVLAEAARLLEAGLIQPNSHESSYENPSQRCLQPLK